MDDQTPTQTLRGVTGIAALIDSGRIEGDVRLDGTVTRLDLDRTNAGHDWAVLDLDDGTGTVEVEVPPRRWLEARHVVRAGARIAVAGRLMQTRDGLHVIGLLVKEQP